MAPNKQAKASRKEFGAIDSKVLRSRVAQRKLLQRRLHDTSDVVAGAAGSHGDEPSIERNVAPPREDRAG